MLDGYEVQEVLRDRYQKYLNIEKTEPTFLVMSDVYMIELRKVDREINYTQYRGAEIRTTIRRGVIEFF